MYAISPCQRIIPRNFVLKSVLCESDNWHTERYIESHKVLNACSQIDAIRPFFVILHYENNSISIGAAGGLVGLTNGKSC